MIPGSSCAEAHGAAHLSDAPLLTPGCHMDKPEVRDTLSFKILFPINRYGIDPDFLGNRRTLDDLNAFLLNLKADTTCRIVGLRICGSASPEGPSDLNERLVEKRADALRGIISTRLSFSRETPCDKLPPNIRELSRKAETMAIPVEELYTGLRYAQADFTVARTLPARPAPPTPEQQRDTLPAQAPFRQEPSPAPAPVEGAYCRWHLKTNLIGWAMSVGNIAIERDFGPHFSVALPIYYSGVNYFTRTIKFRTFTLQPEVRYWLTGHSGTPPRWYVGAHVGVGWFNYALNGDYRLQDTDGNTPAWGGGVSAGYRLTLPWGDKNRWKMEFALGVGIYDAHYDKWLNIPDGRLEQGRVHTTFVGIDQAAATLIYSF